MMGQKTPFLSLSSTPLFMVKLLESVGKPNRAEPMKPPAEQRRKELGT